MLRRSPLKRFTRLRARKPMRQSSHKRTTLADMARLEWLHRQPCAIHGPSCGPVDVHHATYARGLGQKAPHDHGIPLCHAAHMDFHAATGPFKGWDRERRREWQSEMVETYQTAFNTSTHQ